MMQFLVTQAFPTVLGPRARAAEHFLHTDLVFMCVTLMENAEVLVRAVDDAVTSTGAKLEVVVGEMLLVLLACVRTARRFFAARGEAMPVTMTVQDDYWPLLNFRLLTAAPAHTATCARLLAVTIACGSDTDVAALRKANKLADNAVAMLEPHVFRGVAFLCARSHEANFIFGMHNELVWRVEPKRNAAHRMLFTNPQEHVRECEAQLRAQLRVSPCAVTCIENMGASAIDALLAPYVSMAREAPLAIGLPLLGCGKAVDVMTACRADVNDKMRLVERVMLVTQQMADLVARNVQEAGAKTLSETGLLTLSTEEVRVAEAVASAAPLRQAACGLDVPLPLAAAFDAGRPAPGALVGPASLVTPERRRRMSVLLCKASANGVVCAAMLGSAEGEISASNTLHSAKRGMRHAVAMSPSKQVVTRGVAAIAAYMKAMPLEVGAFTLRDAVRKATQARLNALRSRASSSPPSA